jgi:anti-sigma regulatory factor (Ser/Thr protein kinase)
MTEALPGPVEIRVPTSLVFVRPVRKMVEALLAGQGWGEEAVEDAGLVFTELLQNAIEHGSKADGGEHVHVLCAVEQAAVGIEVTDPGTGKDPREVLSRDVTRPVPPDEARGRGLFLVNRMARCLDRGLSGGGGCCIRVRLERAAL